MAPTVAIYVGFCFMVCFLSCIVAMASPLTLLIGYYHGLLLRNIKTSLLSKYMLSKGLISIDDQSLISTGCSVYQQNWLLLERVRHMDTKMFLEFCKLILNLWPEIGSQLIIGMFIFIKYMHTYTGFCPGFSEWWPNMD